MTAPLTHAPELAPLPTDEALPGLLHLLDPDWVWERYCATFGEPDEAPDRIRPLQLLYRQGRRALLAYAAERRWDQWVVEEQFAIELRARHGERVFRYPDDPYLPGLARAASAADAQTLLTQHVSLHPQRLNVELLRYRPGNRAVLRHIAGWRRGGAPELTLYARAMPPKRIGRLIRAAEIVRHSGFALPEIIGCWEEGGVAWLTNAPGETVRSLIRAGTPPRPGAIIEPLAQLWAVPLSSESNRGFDLPGSFEWTERLLSCVLPEGDAHETLRLVADRLRPFAGSWRPTALAHNDFYDDQLVLTPAGTLALVDFEEAGPGDPLLDVGNLLAHLRWMSRSGANAEACAAYHQRFRAAALQRFGWSEHDLALREAFAIFRLSTNPFRQLRRDWPLAVQQGLELALETLDEA
ncbi:MAG: phosphotransferase [Dehalococcoidia bacterium]